MHAVNMVENPVVGTVVTLGAKMREDDDRDDRANSAGFWFGAALSERSSSQGVASYGEAKGGVVYNTPILPSDYIDD